MLHGVSYESWWVMTSGGGVVIGPSGGVVPSSGGVVGGETVPGWLAHGPGSDQEPTTETKRPVVTSMVVPKSSSVCSPSSPPSVHWLLTGYWIPPASVKPNS